MKTLSQPLSLALLLALTSCPLSFVRAADAPEQAALVKEKIQTLRTECAQGRQQVTVTVEELARLTAKNVELRPQFEKFKAELVKMEGQAAFASTRADAMKSKGQEFFADWEQQIKSIQNEDIRKSAEKRLAKRKKSYDKIISATQEAKAELVPFMSDLNDIKTLLDAELTQNSVASAKKLIKQAGLHGKDVAESLQDVELELDRVAAELAKYE
jgi:chromosome segregation ATPase